MVDQCYLKGHSRGRCGLLCGGCGRKLGKLSQGFDAALAGSRIGQFVDGVAKTQGISGAWWTHRCGRGVRAVH